jgi:hypothetical protein
MCSIVSSITPDLSCPSISYDPVLVRKAGKLEVGRWKERSQVCTLRMLEQHTPMSLAHGRKIKFKVLIYYMSCPASFLLVLFFLFLLDPIPSFLPCFGCYLNLWLVFFVVFCSLRLPFNPRALIS